MKRLISVILSMIFIAAAAFSTVSAVGFTAEAADTNLAEGCDYDIYTEANIDNAFPNLVLKDDGKILTDGVKAPASVSYSDARYLKIHRGVYNTVQIDLGKNVFVNGFSAGFYAHTPHGVYLPREVYFSVSKDGVNWYTLYELIDNTIAVSEAKRREEIGKSGTDYYEARYVRIKFATDVYVFTDEIEVYGVKSGVTGKQYTYDTETVYPDAFSPKGNEAIDGADNIVLIYNGAYYKDAESQIGLNTYDDLLPYAAYVGKDKSIADTMFNSFLFLPLNPGEGEYGLDKQTGWEVYLDNTIGTDENINLTALDKLIGDLKNTLSLDEGYKANVFITVPYVGFSDLTAFGTLDGNTQVKADSLENEISIIKWYIDLALEKYSAAGFENLNLAGFYWYEEVVLFAANEYEVDFIKAYNSYVHEKDYGSIWIPYYCSPGSYMWKELGFDCACLQSGYAFPRDSTSETGSQLEGVVSDSMTFAKKYGMGVEMEISSSAYSRYDVYIKNAVKLGCMDNGVTMFYQEGGPGFFSTACYSASTRYIYDMTYSYIKQKYEKCVPQLDFASVILVEKNADKSHGTLPVTDGDTNKTKLKISGLETVSHGELSIDGEGFFVYVPEADYAGKDSFSFSVTDGYNISEMFTVNILVVDKLFTYGSEDAGLKNGKAVLYTDSSDNSGTTETSVDGDYKIFEVAVNSEGAVISASYTENSQIPENGFVISAAGVKAAELETLAEAGKTVTIDRITKSVCFAETNAGETSRETVSETESASSTPSDEEGGNTFIIVLFIIIIAVIVAAAVIIKIIKFKK